MQTARIRSNASCSKTRITRGSIQHSMVTPALCKICTHRLTSTSTQKTASKTLTAGERTSRRSASTTVRRFMFIQAPRGLETGAGLRSSSSSQRSSLAHLGHTDNTKRMKSLGHSSETSQSKLMNRAGPAKPNRHLVSQTSRLTLKLVSTGSTRIASERLSALRVPSSRRKWPLASCPTSLLHRHGTCSRRARSHASPIWT